MAIIYVKKDGSGDALTIQQGIQLADLGDIVEVEAGTFDENIDLWKGVILKGAGIGSTIVTGALRSAITARTFTWTLGSTVLNVAAGADISAYEVGRIITATGIPANARIVSKTSSTLTISAATTQAAATARVVAMALQNDATMRVRGGTGVIRDMKIAGFDHPNPATEYAAIYFRNTGLGSNPANGWEMFNVECEANGEYGLLTDFGAGVGNLNIHDCKFSGKTFVGSNPASGNQFSVWNVPRQLVTVQGVNTGVNKFMNNEIVGITGGLTILGVASFNTAVTFDPANSIVSGNIINGTFGYGYALRVRGSGLTLENNTNYSFPGNENAGYLIGPTGSQVSGMTVGTNSSITAELISVEQTAGESFVSFEMSKEVLKQNSAVSSHPTFSDEANWNMVSYVFKHDSSSRRLVGSFKDFSSTKKSKLKVNMEAGDRFELHKIILATSPRDLLVLKRSQISGASGFDFDLLNDGPEASDGGGNTPSVVSFELFQNYPTYSPLVDPTTLTRTLSDLGQPISLALSNQSLGALSSGVGNFDVTFNFEDLSDTSGRGTYFGILFSDSSSVSLSDVNSGYEVSSYMLIVDSNANLGTRTIGTGGYTTSTGVVGSVKSLRFLQEGDNQLKIYQDGNLINTITVANTSKLHAYPFVRSYFQHKIVSVEVV
jgi:hypothetical protein